MVNADFFNQQMGSGALDPGQALQELQRQLNMGSQGVTAQASSMVPSASSLVPGGTPQMSGQPNFGADLSQGNFMATPQNSPNQFPGGGNPFNPVGPAGGYDNQQDLYNQFIQRGFTPDWAAQAHLLSPGALQQALSGFGTRGFGAADDMLMTGRVGQMVGSGMNQPYQQGSTHMNNGVLESVAGSYPISGGIPGMVNGPSNQWFEMPGTFGLPGAQGMGGPSWSPGQDAVGFLQSLGGQIPQFLQTLNAGQAVGGRGNVGASLRGLGQFGGVPSPQSLGNLQPSEMQFLQGFFETLLGIPMSDVMGASFAPFQGLQRRQNARTATPRRR